MKRLSEYSADRVRLTRDAFISRHPSPVLLHRWETQDEEGEYTSTTAHISMIDLPAKGDVFRPAEPLAALGLTTKVTNSADVVVFPVVKRASGGVLQDRVSIGRNRNADIHLPFRKVSKFHAYFTAAPNATKFFLTDAGSTNGTYLNGRRLSTGQPIEVADRSIIYFSQYLFVFFTSAGLYNLLSGE